MPSTPGDGDGGLSGGPTSISRELVDLNQSSVRDREPGPIDLGRRVTGRGANGSTFRADIGPLFQLACGVPASIQHWLRAGRNG